ncbi:MAG: hypothetical protein DMF92_09340 [Acidobacteria bacterium]|nr:MAG: hypothetical protein DMF92_09340 [Acidobacteriota bacterium]
MVHQQPELLAGLAVFQRVSAAAARSRRAPNAPLLLEDGFSVLIFPEGKRTENGDIATFRPGVGMIASRLEVPVVPVRIEGLEKVLHHTWRMARPGRVRVAFGRPMRLMGSDYEGLAKQVEDAVREL